MTVGVPRGHLGHPGRGRGQVALADVEQDQDGLLGQEPEAPQVLLLVRVERLVADRVAIHEARPEPLEQGRLALVRLALCRGAVAARATEPLQPAVHDRQIRQDELQVELLEVPPGVDGPGCMRQRWVVPRADHVEQRIGVAKSGEVLRRKLLGAHVALGGRRRSGQVHVRHVRVDDLLGVEDPGEAVQPRIRDLDDAHVELQPAKAAGLDVAPGERVEDGGLARAGQPDDRDLHAVSIRPRRPRC